MKGKQCPRCGAHLPQEASFCGKCGSSISKNNKEFQNSPKCPKHTPRLKRLLAGFIIIGFVLFLVYGVTNHLKNNKKELREKYQGCVGSEPRFV